MTHVLRFLGNRLRICALASFIVSGRTLRISLFKNITIISGQISNAVEDICVLDWFDVLIFGDVRRLFNFCINQVEYLSQIGLELLPQRLNETNLAQCDEASASQALTIFLIILIFAHEIENGFHRSLEELVVALKLRQVFDELWNKLHTLFLNLKGLTIINQL